MSYNMEQIISTKRKTRPSSKNTQKMIPVGSQDINFLCMGGHLSATYAVKLRSFSKKKQKKPKSTLAHKQDGVELDI